MKKHFTLIAVLTVLFSTSFTAFSSNNGLGDVASGGNPGGETRAGSTLRNPDDFRIADLNGLWRFEMLSCSGSNKGQTVTVDYNLVIQSNNNATFTNPQGKYPSIAAVYIPEDHLIKISSTAPQGQYAGMKYQVPIGYSNGSVSRMSVIYGEINPASLKMTFAENQGIQWWEVTGQGSNELGAYVLKGASRAYLDRFVSDGLIYTTIDHTAKTCKVSGYEKGKIGTNVKLKSSVINLDTEYTVTQIGAALFRDYTSLTGVEIPSSIIAIGSEAFYNCKNLKNITIPSSVRQIGSYAFSYMPISEINLPALSEIPEGLLANCSNLKNVNIPAGVTSIGANAFYNCTSLSSILLSDNITKIGEKAFYNTAITQIHLPSALTSIPANLCLSCKNLREVTIPEKVMRIGEYAFAGCENLETLDIQSLVLEIEPYAFNAGATSMNIPLFIKNLSLNCSTIKDWFKDFSNIETLRIGSNVKNIDKGAFATCTRLSDLEIDAENISDNLFENRKLLVNLKLGQHVKTIGNSAFYGCTNISSLEIPKSVTKIGSLAFTGCRSIKTIKFEDGDKVLEIGAGDNDKGMFRNSPLESVYIGRDYKCVLNYAVSESTFMNITSIKEVTFGNYVTTITKLAFKGCTGLKKVVFGNKVATIENNAFNKCTGLNDVVIPKSVVKIEENAFDGCTSLKNLSFEDGNNKLEFQKNVYLSGFFRDCPISTLYLGRNLSYSAVTPYGDSPFQNKTSLKELTIGNSVTSIPSRAFIGCKGLTSVEIPASVNSIEYEAFSGCTALKKLRIEDGNKQLEFKENAYSYTTWFFRDCPIESIYLGRNLAYASSSHGHSPFEDKTTLKEVAFGNSVTSIGKYAFAGCTGIVKIELPQSVTSLEENAFYRCTGIVNINLSKSLTSLGEGAFSGCSGIVNIELPKSLTSLGGNAFYNCKSLKKISINSDKQLSMGKSVFGSCPSIQEIYCNTNIPPKSNSFDVFNDNIYKTASLFVPAGKRTAYASATPWSKFINIIDPADVGVDDIVADDLEVVTVISLDGKILMNQAPRADLELLAPGLYIINGKKVMIVK